MNSLTEKLIDSKTVITIAGATASGKTDLSIALSEYLPIEIISSDSRQVYKYLDIGTAKPSKDELSKVIHHKIDFLEPDSYYSAGQYAKECTPLIDELFSQNKIPVIVGGSGLYIKALCEGMFDDGLDTDYSAVREELEAQLAEEGLDALYLELSQIDPPSAQLYIEKNPRRIIRALEYYYTHGIPLSTAQKQFDEKRNFNTLYFAIDWDRQTLYDRINRRTHIMWGDGLVQETENVLNMGYTTSLNSLNTVGYKETIDYINGEISEAKAIELIQQHTRNYAKRQITWFKKIPNINWIKNNPTELIKLIK